MRIRACALAFLVFTAPAFCHAPHALAQGSEADPFTDMARQRFQEGVQLFDQGKFEEARAAFLQAYALKKHPAVLLNLAQSELHSGHSVEAARHFSQFLRESPNADSAESQAAQEGLALARTKTGRIDVKVDIEGADVFVDGEMVGRAPLPEAVDAAPGMRTVEVKMPGRATQTAEASVEVGQIATVNLVMDGSSPGAPAPVPSGEQGPKQESFSVSTEGRKSFVDWFMDDEVAWATGGATVAFLGAGITFALLAQSASNSADNTAGQIKVVAERDPELEDYKGSGDRRSNPCAEPVATTSQTDYSGACAQLQDNMDARDTDKHLATAGFVLAGLGVAATGVLYFVRTQPETETVVRKEPARRTMIAPVIGPEIRGFAIGGTF